MFNLIKKLFNINKVSSLSINQNNKDFYFLNDPSTPDLKSNINNIFIPQYMPFLVKDFDPRNYKLIRENDYRNLACFYTISQMLNYYQNIIYKIEQSKIKQWFGNKPLFIQPIYSSGLNAFYDRNSLLFCYKTSIFKKRTVYAVDSVDIVSHELGHAILDSLRPDFWNMQSLEIWSFHEAFADVCAFINVTNNVNIIDRIFNETNGDLSKSNIATRIGEDLASSTSLNKKYLRDISKEFEYINPSLINENYNLKKEPHDFSQIISSVWYHSLVEIFKIEKEDNKDNKFNNIQLFEYAKEEAFIALIKTVKSVPATDNFFSAFAKIFILNLKSKYKQYIQNLFEKRKIIKPQIKMLSNKKLTLSDINLKYNDVVLKNKSNSFFITKKKSNNIISSFNEITSLSIDNKNEFFLKIPSDNFYYTENSILIEEILNNEEESIKEAFLCKKYIEENKFENWTIDNKFLIRSKIN